ncbi:hypothetical protein JW711_02645 [Candidatus Woesearchaeota archaeon]|nr:hypothetical protein [Candidatus Woesearchaeota archaeon]
MNAGKKMVAGRTEEKIQIPLHLRVEETMIKYCGILAQKNLRYDFHVAALHSPDGKTHNFEINARHPNTNTVLPQRGRVTPGRVSVHRGYVGIESLIGAVNGDLKDYLIKKVPGVRFSKFVDYVA